MLSRLRSCLALLTPALRRRWAAMVPLTLATAFLEAVAAGGVYALIRKITDPATLAPHPAPAAGDGFIGQTLAQLSVTELTIALALFYVLKNLLLAGIAHLRNHTVATSTATVSQRILRAYLDAPYAFHLRRNSAELIRTATDSVNVAMDAFLKSLVMVATEGLVILGIVAVLMLTSPLATLITVVLLLGIVAGLLKLTQHRLRTFGSRRQELRSRALRNLQQSLGGFKELRVMRRGEYFYDDYAKIQSALTRIATRSMNLVVAPPLLIETGFVIGMLLVVLYITSTGGGGTATVPILGLYAYAGFRVIPSLHRILMYLGSAQMGAAGVDDLMEDFRQLEELARDRHPEDSQIEEVTLSDQISIQNLSFRYERSPHDALCKIDFVIHCGESIGVVGPTGSGKSTLIDVLLGLLKPSSGRVCVDERDIQQCLPSWQRKIGYVPQDIYLMDDSLRRNVALGVHDAEIENDRVALAVHMAQLDEFVAALPEGLETMIGERGVRLSGGQRQRVAIARALYHDPELLVFDEATSSLDAQTEAEVTQAIEALHGRKTMIVIAHRLSTVRQCDRLIFLRKGRLDGIGSFDELLTRNADLREMVVRSELV